ncbi:MAG: 50S ribosomal protein L31e [Thermoplasmata archaeon]
MVEDIERVYIVPLRKAKMAPRTKRAKIAIAHIRRFMARHMRAKEENIWIDEGVNKLIWKNGIQHIPSSVKLKAHKFHEDEVVEVTLPED